MVDSLVELVEVGVGIAEGTLSGRADHFVVLCVILLKILCSLCPLAELGIAESCIEICEVAGIGAAEFISHLQETCVSCSVAIESLLEKLLLEILLSLGERCACLVLTWSGHILLVNNYTGYYHNYCEYACDDGLLILEEEGL